jgi:hypothetical protein
MDVDSPDDIPKSVEVVRASSSEKRVKKSHHHKVVSDKGRCQDETGVDASDQSIEVNTIREDYGLPTDEQFVSTKRTKLDNRTVGEDAMYTDAFASQPKPPVKVDHSGASWDGMCADSFGLNVKPTVAIATGSPASDAIHPVGAVVGVSATPSPNPLRSNGNHPYPRTVRRSGLFIGGRARYPRADDSWQSPADWREVDAFYKPRATRHGQELTSPPSSPTADIHPDECRSVFVEGAGAVETVVARKMTRVYIVGVQRI